MLQAALALFLLKVGMARDGLLALNGAVDCADGARPGPGRRSSSASSAGGAAPFAVTNSAGMVSFAFGILPLVIVISALSALLWHWRILPVIVKAFAFALHKLMGIGGAVGLGAAATIFSRHGPRRRS